MRSYSFETIDVFTDRRFGGNPLAVVTDGRGLSDAEMQAIAREFNLSETTFVLPPQNPGHTAQVRIFTPVTELDFAGHPNVGTALVLAAQHEARPSRFIFEERAGLVPISFDWSATPQATLEAPVALERGGDVPAAVVAACTGLETADIVTRTHPPCIAGVGTPFVIAEVTDAARSRASPDIGAMRDAAARFPVRPIGFPVHLYSRDGQTLHTRMFSPLSGINEDPATGSANAALVALLLACEPAPRAQFTIHQGTEMGRPSLLHGAAWQAADGVRASIGGGGVPVMRGTLALP